MVHIFKFLFIKTILRLFLYVLIALSTGSAVLKLEYTINEVLLIFRVFVAFWNNLFSSSDTKVSPSIMFSSLSSRKKLCYLWFYWPLMCQSIFCILYYIIYHKNSYLSYPFSKIYLPFFLWNRFFLNITFSELISLIFQ